MLLAVLHRVHLLLGQLDLHLVAAHLDYFVFKLWSFEPENRGTIVGVERRV